MMICLMGFVGSLLACKVFCFWRGEVCGEHSLRFAVVEFGKTWNRETLIIIRIH